MHIAWYIRLYIAYFDSILHILTLMDINITYYGNRDNVY